MQTLRVRERLDEWRLIRYTMHRARRDMNIEPSERVVKSVLAKALKKRLVVQVKGRYELGASELRNAKAAKTRAAKQQAKRTPPPRERCYFPATQPDGFERAAKAVKKRFEVFAEKPTSVSFRWRHTRTNAGPDFRLERTERADVLRVMRAWQKHKIRTHTPPFVAFLALVFDDLDEVLDEANGLIEAQHVIANATGGPMFNAWNKTLMTSKGEEVTYAMSL